MSSHIYSNAYVLLPLLLLARTGSLVKADRLQHVILDRDIFQNKYSTPILQDLSQIREQRGIVIPCGGGKMLANAYVAARVVRNYLACDLPIEIAYYGEHEMDAYHKSLFAVSSAVRSVQTTMRYRELSQLVVSCRASVTQH